MSFIKKPNDDFKDEKEYLKDEKEYLKDEKEYLKKTLEYYDFVFNSGIDKDSDLMKYFLYDFFHDGRISKIEFKNGLNEICLELNGPNIQEMKNEKDYEFITSEFQCFFRDVAYFNIETPTKLKRGKGISFNFCDFTFISSEINSLEKYISDYSKIYKEQFFSLNMNILANFYTFYIKMVFRDLYVVPKEPLAFKLLLENPKYKFPTLYLGD
jgi:hypothetical protein